MYSPRDKARRLLVFAQQEVNNCKFEQQAELLVAVRVACKDCFERCALPMQLRVLNQVHVGLLSALGIAIDEQEGYDG